MNRHLHNEQGAALITALLFLMVLSILITTLHYTTLQEQFSSRKYQNSQKSFYAAERGIRRGMEWLAGQGGPPEDNLSCDNPAFSPERLTDGESPVWSDEEAVDGCTNTYHIEWLKNEASTIAGHESAKLGTSTGTGATLHYYRITGKGSSEGVPASTLELQLVTTVTY